jgi:hypothetical protein
MILDFESVLSFKRGRDLLDAAGAAIANFALSKRIIDYEFLVRDSFYCEIKAGTADPSISRGVVDRTFTRPRSDPQPYDSFSSGITTDARKFNVGIKRGNACFFLELELNEESGCLPDKGLDKRNVNLKIWKLFPTKNDRFEKSREVVAEYTMDKWNPACEKETSEIKKAMVIQFEEISMKCTYEGMVVSNPFEKELSREWKNPCSGF